ncbi:uncharacterized protein LOC127122481 [Lathyrus oleraceus]|uniref:uncharacterized protein LOC127122481 n=1 Tax=Pisum sativum TaxID=3888 RepID=UPI0021D0B97E|nr:uncharacterized protein LOC127122481 [Pisum sativum]
MINIRKRKKIEELIQSQVGALDKFLIKESQVSNESRYVDNIDSLPIENDNLDSVPIENDNLNSVPIENDNLDSVPIVDEVNNDDDVDDDDDDNIDYDIFDPRNWDRLQPKLIDLLVVKGPTRDNSIVKGPKDSLNRRFMNHLYTRALANGEVCDRDWLVYSKELDRVFCFCCKVFKNGIVRGKLANEGYSDWVHVGERIKEHELVFRGSKEKLYEDNNGNFLGLIKTLAEFDQIIQEHVRRVTTQKVHIHYLGHNIQNELISLLGSAIKIEIIRKIEHAKYFSAILNCTPDVSHQEPMSLIIRYVDISSASVSIEESFLGFLNVNDTSGHGIFDVLQNELKELGLGLFDVREQGYDNGSNMKGKHQENDLDPKIQNEAKSLATNELGDFEFLMTIIIWFEILSAINFVSKLLQEKDMLIDVAMQKNKGLISYFEGYRETCFYKVLINAKEIAVELNIAPIFPQRRIIKRKRQFDENLNIPSVELSKEESFRVNYFLYLVDQVVVSLNKRFEQYQEYESIFGFLFTSHKLQSLDDATLKSCCTNFEQALKHNEQPDIKEKRRKSIRGANKQRK